jgi:hypothetical protein
MQPYEGLRRFEVGAETSDIRTNCIGDPAPCYVPSFGLGAGASLNLTPRFALDADFLMTPASSTSETNAAGGRASEVLIGPRVEVRGRRYGYFVKAQSGYFEWSRLITGVTFLPQSPLFLFSFGHQFYFASDVSLGFEYNVSNRLHARVEVGDLILRYTSPGYPGSSWNNNLQPSIGVYYGMGKPLDWNPPVYDARKVHPFFDRTNLVLLTGAVLADTADSITTQRFIARGYEEGDPFARPLVKYGWSGQIAAMTLETGGEVGGMYSLHRIGRHWLERLVPVGIAAVHGYFAYENTKAPGRPAMHGE